MRVLIGDNIPPTLPNNDVDENEKPAASKGICAQCQEIFTEMVKTKKVKALNNKLEEKSANVMHLFARQLIIAVLLVENATKHYHVTNEITKR